MYKESLVVNRTGSNGDIFVNQTAESTRQESLLKKYRLQHVSLELEAPKMMKNFFKVGDNSIMVIDADSIKSDFGFEPDILILMNSPRINLDRLLQKIQPKTIVVDGSNYFTFKSFWKRTAEKYQITFYDTSKKGAFTLDGAS